MRHLKKKKEMNYLEHFFFANKYGFLIIKHGLQLIIHGIFPCLFKKAGEELFIKLIKDFRKSELREPINLDF